MAPRSVSLHDSADGVFWMRVKGLLQGRYIRIWRVTDRAEYDPLTAHMLESHSIVGSRRGRKEG